MKTKTRKTKKTTAPKKRPTQTAPVEMREPEPAVIAAEVISQAAPAQENELPTRVRFKAPDPEFDGAAVLAAMEPIAKARGTAASKIAAQVVRYLRIHTKRAYGRKGQRHILDRAQQAIATIEQELAAHAPQAQS